MNKDMIAGMVIFFVPWLIGFCMGMTLNKNKK